MTRLNHLQILALLHVRGCSKHHLRLMIDEADKDSTGIADTHGLRRLLSDVCRLPCSEDEMAKACSEAKKVVRECHASGIGITACTDPSFPHALHNVRYEGHDVAPVLLYWRGNFNLLDNLKGVAVIGTRRVTRQGYADGEYMAGELSRHGCNIISGLAAGTDTAAHCGALAVGGATTAITAFGLAAAPTESASLARRILGGGGLLVTEYEPRTAACYKTLIERDYLQAGMADAVLLVQSNVKRGGSMYAVRTAIENHKPVFAIDYRGTPLEDDHFTQANRLLIEQGRALPVTRSSIQRVREAIE